jgi:hypothetical protein
MGEFTIYTEDSPDLDPEVSFPGLFQSAQKNRGPKRSPCFLRSNHILLKDSIL